MLLDKISVILRCKKSNSLHEFPPYIRESIHKQGYDLVEEYQSTAMMSCRQNYVYKREEGVIYVGFALNTFKEPSDGLKKVKIEWNPQKINIPLAFMWCFLNYGYVLDSVKSIDIAFDFHNSHLSDFTINTTKSVMYVGTHSNLTRYIAPKEKHGRIKIYDKSRERSARGVEYESNVVRVEITCKNPQFYDNDFIDNDAWIYLDDIKKRLSEISISKKFSDHMPVDLQKSVVYLLQNVSALEREHAYHMMSSRTSAKYRAYFKGVVAAPFEVNIVELHKTISFQIRQCINSLLCNTYKI